ncbi:MAG: aminotransferase class I/II-fold pyridoxal phosphate-dependent enzyme [Acidimicrobiia bacterium]|nr:aminotransferase class I/II-fold pyridoxal phosphate-dependent enzyme [Acidimicrobiia bacterium]
MKVNPVLLALAPNQIGLLQELARRRRAAGERVLDFSIGDPLEPTPPFIPEALRRAVPSVSQYPTTPGLPELREAVAGYVKRRFGVEVDPETQVLPTSGAKEAIFSSALAFVDRLRGDLVAWPTPGYPIYEKGAVLAGAEPRLVRLGPDFVFRADDLAEDEWARAAMVWVCSPHNPAGSVTSRSELEELMAEARKGEAWLCSDECYADLYENDPPTSVLEVAGPTSTGALSFLSLSKRSGMTGYRSGVIVGDAEAIRCLKRLRGYTGTASPEFVQRAAIAAWNDDDHVVERREIFRQKRAILREAFEASGMTVVGSVAGIYLWVAVPDDVEIANQLLEENILLTPGRAFGPGGEGYVRLALVPTVDECDEAAARLSKCLAN